MRILWVRAMEERAPRKGEMLNSVLKLCNANSELATIEKVLLL
jgi:hypothetical protein